MGVLLACIPAPPRVRQWILALTMWLPYGLGVLVALQEWHHVLVRAEEQRGACLQQGGMGACDLRHFVPMTALRLRDGLAQVGVHVEIETAIGLQEALLPNLLLPAVLLATLGLAIHRTSPGVLAHGSLCLFFVVLIFLLMQ